MCAYWRPLAAGDEARPTTGGHPTMGSATNPQETKNRPQRKFRATEWHAVHRLQKTYRAAGRDARFVMERCDVKGLGKGADEGSDNEFPEITISQFELPEPEGYTRA